jgi:hypothetical protein
MSERETARAMLRELLEEALAAPNGHRAPEPADAVPRVPAPPVASVLRPSTWSEPPARGEVIGGAASGPAQAAPDAAGRAVEWVTIDSDDDLERFVRALLARFENPRERAAIHNGRLRFSLGPRGAGGGAAARGTARVERGAVTERKVEEAAKAGARLVLGPSAVLTPLAREKARARGIEIERER